MNPTDRGGVIRLAAAQSRIPGSAGERAALILQRGTLDIALSLPVPPNELTPHVQDEIYFVVRGRGMLVYDDKQEPFEPGDILFVAAGTEHHLEYLVKDVAIWRVFYGCQ